MRFYSFKLIFLFLLFCVNIYSVVNEFTYVIREADTSKRDKFGPGRLNCDQKTASQSGDGCECQYSTSTFLLYQNGKSCVPNAEVEKVLKLQQDCNGKKVLFKGQNSGGPYSVFNLTKVPDNTSATFNNVNRINGESCKVDQTSYIDDLSGKLITPSTITDVFTINKGSKKLHWTPGDNLLRYQGRIFRLKTSGCTFKMTSGKGIISDPCILLKAEGRIDFSVSSSISSSLPSINPTGSTATVTSALVSVTSTKHVSQSTIASIPVQPSPTMPGKSSAVTVLTPSSQSPSLSTTHKGNNKDKNTGNEDDSSLTGAIVGAVLGFVLIAAIVLLVLCRKRKQKSRSNKKTAGNAQMNKDNPVYGKNDTIDLSKQNRGAKITGNELEYDYAAVDGDPRASNGAAPVIYQSLIKDPNRESVYTPLERQETNEYNKVEREPFKPARNGPTDPTYNVLERPSDNNDDYLEPGSHIDKNKRPHSKLAPQNNEPVYNVLEGPNPEGEDEPEYNVLEDPDDNYDNTPVETDRGHPSSHDNVGYASTIDFKKRQGTKNEPVYEAPEGPSSELTYQPLQINGQDNVYQPLDRTSRMIPDDQPVYHVLESQGSEA